MNLIPIQFVRRNLRCLQLLTGLMLLSFVSASCATKTVTFSSNQKATVSLVTSRSPDGQGEIIGETPQTLPAAKFEGKVVKIWSPEIYPQYWVLDPLPNGETAIQLSLEKKPESQQKGGAATNVKYRIVMKAYKALADQNWKLARDLADELGKIEPEAAAPHLISGIAFLREGKKGDAHSAFEKARTLDPEDAEIAKLIRISQ